MATINLKLVLCTVLCIILNVSALCNETFDTFACRYNIYCQDDFNGISSWDRYSENYRPRHIAGCHYINFNGHTIHPISLMYKDNYFNSISEFGNSDSSTFKLITYLDLSNNYYIDFPNIRYMTNLNTINLSYNSITVATLSNLNELPALREINLSHNEIIHVDKLNAEHSDQLRALENINLSYNSLTEVLPEVFDSFDSLTILDLSFNNINKVGQLSFEGVKNLVHLNMSHNFLSDTNASLFRFRSLLTLDLSYNKINRIKTDDFNHLSSLKILNLKSNLITIVDTEIFTHLSNLESLDLSDNQLEVLDKDAFKNVNDLKQVLMSNNQFKGLPKSLFKDKRIVEFSIIDNNLEGPIERGMFEGLEFVEELDLSNQHLDSIEDNAFYGLGQLVTLLLQNNNIRVLSLECFNMLPNLKQLDLSYNEIKDIEFNKAHLDNLEILLIRNNYLTAVKHEHFKGLDTLQVLDLSNNRISRMESDSFKSLKNLISFEMSNNPLNGTLEQNTFDGLNSLPSLDISCTFLNKIQNGSFNGMIQLKNLNISRSKIENLQFNSFICTGSMRILDLSNNRINEFIVNNTHISNLETLYLNNNNLKTLDPVTFNQMLSITKLIVSYNEIEETESFKFPNNNSLNILDLSYNSKLMFNQHLINNTYHLAELYLSGTKTGLTLNEIENVLITHIEISDASIEDIVALKLNILRHLNSLYLSHNQITQINFTCFANLSTLNNLDLSFNKINYIQPGAFKDNTELHTLNISHNYLKSITYGIFNGLVYLHTLDISYNNIDNLQHQKFNDLKSLNVLIADGNRIERIKAEEFLGTNLTKLSIGDNPIPCSLLVEFRRSNVTIEITAIKLDEHNHENSKGVTCNKNKYISDKNLNFSAVDNENLKSVLIDIRNIIHDKLNSDDRQIPKSDNKDFLVNITNQIAKTNHENQIQLSNLTYLASEIANKNDSNVLLERILKVLTINSIKRPTTPTPITKNNATYDNLVNYINKLKQQLEDTIAFEKNNILNEVDVKLSSINKDSVTLKPVHEELRTSSPDSKPIFTETCVALILLILVCLVLFKFYKSGLFMRKRLSVSTRELPGAMDSVL